MTGESDLGRLLAGMRPALHPGTYVFVTLDEAAEPAGLAPVMRFREAEGTTLILPEAEALRAGLSCAFPCRWITLTVHSSLAAIGFLATVTARLATSGIAVNVVSAFHHDHLFVPVARAEEAMRRLGEFFGEGSGGGVMSVACNCAAHTRYRPSPDPLP